MGAEDGDGPAVLHEACGELDTHVVEAVVAEAVPHAAAALGVEALRGDVDGTAHGGCGEDGGAETALCLYVGRYVAEAGPVAPIYPAAFHVVYGDTVDEDSDVGALEAAHVDFCIAEAAAVFGCPYAGGGVEYFGEFHCAEFHVYLSLVDLRHGHGSLTRACQRLGYDHVVEDFVGGLELDSAHVGFDGLFGRLIADVAYAQSFGVGRNAHVEGAVHVGRTQGTAARYHDARTDYGLALFVYYRTLTGKAAAGCPDYCLAHQQQKQ